MSSILSSPACMHVAKALHRKTVEANRGGPKVYWVYVCSFKSGGINLSSGNGSR